MFEFMHRKAFDGRYVPDDPKSKKYSTIPVQSDDEYDEDIDQKYNDPNKNKGLC